jgi:hypothetical protein
MLKRGILSISPGWTFIVGFTAWTKSFVVSVLSIQRVSCTNSGKTHGDAQSKMLRYKTVLAQKFEPIFGRAINGWK